MGNMSVIVINNSDHDFRCVGSWGDDISCYENVLIPRKSAETIGTIDLPIQHLSSGNWGWWYLQDEVNKTAVELFAFADPDSHDGDKVSAGLRSNSHDKEMGASRTLEGYFDTEKNKYSFKLIIQSKWTDNPPAPYIFNLGHYDIRYFPVLYKVLPAAHTYLKAISFDGKHTVNFNCYGGTTPDDPSLNWVYPAYSVLADEDRLLLARAICRFEIDESEKSYGKKPNVDDMDPVGRLHLGDCCGIIYAHSGVCHQMTNRILNSDIVGKADPHMYVLSSAVWGKMGEFNNSAPRELQEQAYFIFSKIFPLTDYQLRELGVYENSPDKDVQMLYKPWSDYFWECWKLVEEYKKKKNKEAVI